MDITQGNLNTVAKEHIATYCDNRLALIDDLHTLGQTNAVRVEFIIAALCIKGRASLYINGEAYTMNEYDLLICHPNIILEKSMVSADVQFRCICMSPEYISQLAVISNNSWDILKYLEQNPILTLKPEEADMFRQYYDLLRSKLTGTPLRHQKEIVDSLIQSFLYEFHDAMERFGKFATPTYSSSERLFKEFLHLLVSCRQAARHAQIPLCRMQGDIRRNRFRHHQPIRHQGCTLHVEEIRKKYQGNRQRVGLPQHVFLREIRKALHWSFSQTIPKTISRKRNRIECGKERRPRNCFEFRQKVFLGLMYPFSCVLWTINSKTAYLIKICRGYGNNTLTLPFAFPA